MATQQATINDKREIFGWAMYDWANSAFSTTVGTVFLGPYIAGLATEVAKAEYLARTGTEWVEGNGGSLAVHLFGLPMAPEAVFTFAISLSVVFQAGFLPILGAIADYSHRRKQMLQLFAVVGALATIALFFVTINTWIWGPVLFLIANLAFGASIVFYNAYLPDIASEEERDRVSSYGFALGYLGGFILLALNLVLYLLHDKFGVSEAVSVRINLASAGVWWLGFSSITWRRVRSRHTAHVIPPGDTLFSVTFKQLSKTMEASARLIAFLLLSPLLIFIWVPLITPYVTKLIIINQLDTNLAILPVFIPLFGPVVLLVIFLRNKAKSMPETSKYLTAYLIYNDGIQTVIAVASTFAAAPLLRGGLELSQQILIAVILMIQFVAFGGALFWGKLAKWIGSQRAIIVSLIIWAGVVIYSYSGMRGSSRTIEFIILGAIIATVLGGSQAISRSLFAQMIPKNKEAEFFSIYEISERGTSWLGTLVFGVAVTVFGNLRVAILALIFFFVVGLLILPFVNVNKAIEDVKNLDQADS